MSEPGNEDTIEELKAAAEGGDPDAFMAYCVRSLPALYRYMRYQCSLKDIGQQSADGFCHDAILKARDSIHSRVANQQPISICLQWLKTIAYRLMLDYLRRAGRWVSENDFDDQYVESPEDSDSLEEITKFFEMLTPAEQEVIEQVIVKKREWPEAAYEMGISVEAAKKRFHRAVAHLRDFVHEHGTLPVG